MTPRTSKLAVVGAVVVIVAVGSALGLRAAAISRSAPHAPGRRVAVIGVEGAAWGDEAVARLLDRTPGVSVIPAAEVRSRLRMLQAPDVFRRPHPEQTLRDAERELGLYAVVSGSLGATVHLEATSPVTGKVVATGDAADVGAAAITLGSRLGEGPPPPRVPPTRDLAAYDAFVAGRAALEQDRFDDAAARAKEAMAKDPGFGAAGVLLAEASLDHDDGKDPVRVADAKAGVALATAHDADLSVRERLLAAGYGAWADGRTEDALDAFRKLTVQFPEDPSAYLALGRAYNRLLGAHDEALHHLENARRLTPDDLVIVKEIEDAWLALGERRSALREMKAYVKLVPDDPAGRAEIQKLSAPSPRAP